jgi:DNA-binding ferritin-like protein
VLEQTNNRPADQLSALNEASKAAFEHLQRQSLEKEKTNKTMALELKKLTRTVEELKTDMRSILDLLQQNNDNDNNNNNNNNNNHPPAANPPVVAGVEQAEPVAAGK